MPARKNTTAPPAYFAVLGINASATKREAKRAYMKASREAHPDKGGDLEKMKAVNAAYEAYNGKTTHADSYEGGDNNANGDDGDDSMEITDSDRDYSEAEAQSEGDSAYASASDSEVSKGEGDGARWAFGNDYGDLEETGGRYAVLMEDGGEVSLEEHESICGCDLDAKDSPHHRKIAMAVHDCGDADKDLSGDDEDDVDDSGIEDSD